MGSWFFLSLALLQVILKIYEVSGQSVTTPRNTLFPVNGSNPTETGQLVDGIVPTLNFETSQWASQLVTQRSTINPPMLSQLRFDFREGSARDIEIIMFNCPQWNIGAQTISVIGYNNDEEEASLLQSLDLPVSCSSLVHICVRPFGFRFLEVGFDIQTEEEENNPWVHIAEVIFSNDRGCPTNLLLPPSALGSIFNSRPQISPSIHEQSINGSLLGSDFSRLATDGVVPTLSNLDSKSWASELLTLITSPQDVDSSAINGVDIDITLYRHNAINSVEIVMFNCPEWNIGADTITVFAETVSPDGEVVFTGRTVSGFPTSCIGLVHVCVPVASDSGDLRIQFGPIVAEPNQTHRWIHLGEVIFPENGCPTDLLAQGVTGEKRYSMTTLILIGVGSGLVGCIIFGSAWIVLLTVCSKRHHNKSCKKAPPKERVTTNVTDNGASKGKQQTQRAQEEVRSAARIGFQNQNFASPPLHDRQPPDPLPHTSINSPARPNRPPEPLPRADLGNTNPVGRQSRTPPTDDTNAGGSAVARNLVGESTPPENTGTYLEVLGRSEAEENEEMYEDMDEAGSYLNPDQVHSNFNICPNNAYIMADQLQDELARQ